MATSIAVAGKGGTGKTTITALIVRYLKEKKKGPVLVMDADPDANLGTLLGIKPEKSLGDLREEILREIKRLPSGMSKAAYLEAGLHQIIAEADGFDLIAMGRGEGPGCYCYLNSLIRKFSEDLTPSYAWVVMDNEAGLEHLSRRTTNNIDALLVVVNENPLSFDTAKSIESITANIKNAIRKKYLVTNMVRPEKFSVVNRRIASLNLEHIGDIPLDSVLENAIFEGQSLMTIEGSSAFESVGMIMKSLGA
ncbi:MAG: AAA family ATPase [Chitinivibrionales bacterium]